MPRTRPIESVHDRVEELSRRSSSALSILNALHNERCARVARWLASRCQAGLITTNDVYDRRRDEGIEFGGLAQNSVIAITISQHRNSWYSVARRSPSAPEPTLREIQWASLRSEIDSLSQYYLGIDGVSPEQLARCVLPSPEMRAQCMRVPWVTNHIPDPTMPSNQPVGAGLASVASADSVSWYTTPAAIGAALDTYMRQPSRYTYEPSERLADID